MKYNKNADAELNAASSAGDAAADIVPPQIPLQAAGGGHIGMYGVPLTLEAHLSGFSSWKHYRRLWPNWCESKDKWTRMLKDVDLTFPQYSSHDHEHSAKVVEYIEQLLGPARIALLSPTDTWLILQCAYTHDLGMRVEEDEKIELFKNVKKDRKHARELLDDADYKKYIKHMWDKKYYPYSGSHSPEKASSIFWTKQDEPEGDDIFNENVFGEEFSMALYYFNLTVSNWFRKMHAERSAQRILEEAGKNDSGDLFSGRLASIIAGIVRLHTSDWTSIKSELDKQQNGIHTDHVHPQYIAALLRMGDLLDLDTNRFSSYRISALGDIVPESAAHMLKHSSITTLNVTEDKIQVIARFETAQVKRFLQASRIRGIDEPGAEDGGADGLDERAHKLTLHTIKSTRSWMEWIKSDAKELTLAWKDIAPDNMPGAAPWPDRLSIFLDGQEINESDLQIRYEISAGRASRIIEGSGLYDTRFVFLREIIQNALDATKRQLFRSISDNYRPIGTRDAGGGWEHCKNPQPYDSLFGSYPYFICKYGEMIDKYKVIVDLYLEKDNAGLPSMLVVEVNDRGIGITRDRLEKMKHIGEIKDDKLRDEYYAMPQWLRPTADFGIGMQSVFLVADRFQIESMPPEKEDKHAMQRRITFNSTRLGGDIINDERDRDDRDAAQGQNLALKYPYGSKAIISIGLANKSALIREMFYVKRQNYDQIEDLRLYLEEKLSARLKKYLKDNFSGEIVPIKINFWHRHQGKDTYIRSINHRTTKHGHVAYKDSKNDPKLLFLKNGSVLFWHGHAPADGGERDSQQGMENQAGICLRLSRCAKNASPQANLYFRGIAFKDLVDNPLHESITRLIYAQGYTPEFNCQIDMMGGKAQNVIEINRDKVNNVNYSRIRRTIRDCFRSFYETMLVYLKTLADGDPNADAQYLLEKIVNSTDITAKYILMLCFVFNLQKDRQKLAEFLRQKCANSVGGLMVDLKGAKAYYGNYAIREYCGRANMSDYDPYFANASDSAERKEVPLCGWPEIDGCRDNNAQRIYAMENAFPGIVALNYREVVVFAPQTAGEGFLSIYKLTAEETVYPDIDDASLYLTICSIVSFYLLKKGNCDLDYHPVFPATSSKRREFCDLSVPCPPIGADDIETAMYSLWIVSPLPLRDYSVATDKIGRMKVFSDGCANALRKLKDLDGLGADDGNGGPGRAFGEAKGNSNGAYRNLPGALHYVEKNVPDGHNKARNKESIKKQYIGYINHLLDLQERFTAKNWEQDEADDDAT